MLQFLVDPSSRFETGSTAPAVGTVMTVVVIGVVVCIVIGILAYRLIRALRRPELHGTSREQIAHLWVQIEASSNQGIMGTKLAIIEADKLLDRVLRSMYFPGDTLGERLKSAAFKYPAIRQVWGAHRLRNQLVHDTTFEITIRKAKQALDDYRAALKVLNVM